MYNTIWEEGEIPKSWKDTILKKGKDSKDVMNYRPEALTNILYKIFKRMKNKRLV